MMTLILYSFIAIGSLAALVGAWRLWIAGNEPRRTTYKLRELIGQEPLEAKAHARLLDDSHVVVLPRSIRKAKKR